MIMAGGSGTRLWPMSRKAEPKQLLPFIDGKSLLQHAVERAAVDGQVLDDREGLGPEGLEPQGLPVVEVAHVELADGRPFLAPVRNAVYHLGAHAADSLPAVMVKSDRLFAIPDQTFVDQIEHLKE